MSSAKRTSRARRPAQRKAPRRADGGKRAGRNTVVAGSQQARAGGARRKANDAPGRLPRVPKGRRAQFHADPATDQLFAIVTALTAELSVAFERIATLEQLLEMGGTLRREVIESHRPEGAEAEARRVARDALIARVFQVLEAYAGATD